METETLDENRTAEKYVRELAPYQRAVVRQFGGLADFRESARDIAEHGAGAGWAGFCYYSDTVPFGRRWAAAIMHELAELAADCGTSLADMLAAWPCINATASELVLALADHDPDSEGYTELYNALAWYALEETARRLCDD